MMVDAVNAVLEIPDSEIKSASRFGTHIHADFINGIGKINGKFVIILNIQQVLSMDDMAIVGVASAAEVAQVNRKELVGELA